MAGADRAWRRCDRPDRRGRTALLQGRRPSALHRGRGRVRCRQRGSRQPPGHRRGVHGRHDLQYGGQWRPGRTVDLRMAGRPSGWRRERARQGPARQYPRAGHAGRGRREALLHRTRQQLRLGHHAVVGQRRHRRRHDTTGRPAGGPGRCRSPPGRGRVPGPLHRQRQFERRQRRGLLRRWRDDGQPGQWRDHGRHGGQRHPGHLRVCGQRRQCPGHRLHRLRHAGRRHQCGPGQRHPGPGGQQQRYRHREPRPQWRRLQWCRRGHGRQRGAQRRRGRGTLRCCQPPVEHRYRPRCQHRQQRAGGHQFGGGGIRRQTGRRDQQYRTGPGPGRPAGRAADRRWQRQYRGQRAGAAGRRQQRHHHPEQEHQRHGLERRQGALRR